MWLIRIKRSVSILFLLKMEYTLVRSQYSLLANQLTERPWRRSSSSISLPMCIIMMLMHYEKGGTIRNLYCSEVPPSTACINKYEQFTPI